MAVSRVPVIWSALYEDCGSWEYLLAFVIIEWIVCVGICVCVGVYSLFFSPRRSSLDPKNREFSYLRYDIFLQFSPFY